MSYKDDPAGYERRLRAKLEPASIRANLEFAGLYLMTHQMIKQQVQDKVREFYCFGLDDDDAMTARDRNEYSRQVLSLVPKNKFKASLAWLVNSEAITHAQSDRLDAIYEYRKLLAHELARVIIDPDENTDVQLFLDAITILRTLHRFWIDVELSTGGFFPLDGSPVGDIDPDDVVPFQLIVLQQCLDAYVAGLEAAAS